MYRDVRKTYKRKISVIVLMMLLFSVIFTGCMKKDNNLLGSATPEMTSVEYWKGSDEPVMTHDEIEKYNQMMVDEYHIKVTNLLASDEVIAADDVISMIDKYSFDKDCHCLDTHKITKADKEKLLDERNIEAIKGTITVKYGIVTEPANIRSMPTNKALTEDAIVMGPKCCDNFQLTRFRLGEGVLVYSKSKSNDWLFVQGSTYCGWIEASKVGLCSREAFEQYITDKNFLVATERKDIIINNKLLSISMGTKFLLDGDRIVIPVRAKNGRLLLKRVDSIDIATNEGYLPYTTNNLYKLALGQLGDRYDWGGREGHYDCSDFIMAVYSVFGITLPRDSYEEFEYNIVDLNDVNNESKLIPGAILVMDGHFVLFLGKVNGEMYGIHVLYSSYDNNKNYMEPLRTVLSSFNDIWRHGGKDTMRSTIYEGINIGLEN